MNLLNFFQYFKLVCSARRLGNNDFKRVKKIASIYFDLEKKTNMFRKQTGIQCPKSCGRCCENPFVETTVLEMLPLAAHFWQTKQAENWLEKKSKEDLQERGCPFYQADSVVKGRGRCTVYPFRPLICRLFGFSVKQNKNDRKELYTCEVMKTDSRLKPLYLAASSKISSLKAPLVGDYMQRCRGLSQEVDSRSYPIDEAFLKALKKVGFYYGFKNK